MIWPNKMIEKVHFCLWNVKMFRLITEFFYMHGHKLNHFTIQPMTMVLKTNPFSTIKFQNWKKNVLNTLLANKTKLWIRHTLKLYSHVRKLETAITKIDNFMKSWKKCACAFGYSNDAVASDTRFHLRSFFDNLVGAVYVV